MAKLKAKVPARPRVPPLPALPSLQELKDRSAFERLLYSIREVESQHDRAAFNPRSGARGSMQIIPEVHEAGAGYGVPLLPTGASPEQMEAHGRVYFERLLGAFGNARDAAIAYNWGPTNARNWIKSGRKVEALPKETRDYVARISNFYQRESSLPLDKQMPKGRVLRREEIPPPPPQPAPSVLGAPPQTAAQPSPVEPSPVEPSPVKPSPVPPFVAPEEEQFDWMGPAMGGSPPVREPRAANRERDAAAALALLEQARRFLPPGPRPVAFADGGPVDLATVASAGSGPDEEMRRGLGSLVDRAKAMFPTPSSAPLFDDTGYERGTVLPLRRNIETGAMEFATPGLIAEPLNAMQRSVAAMRSGQQVQPGDVAEALGLVGATSLALPGSLTRVPAGALGAMKPRGGNWLTETVDDNLSSVIHHPDAWKRRLQRYRELGREDLIRENQLEEYVPVSEWIHRNYRNYILRDMGTPDDPVRKAIDEGVTFGTFEPDDSIKPIRRIFERKVLEGKRRAEGFPPEGYATTPEGKMYETITDEIIGVARREDFLPENIYGSRFVDPYEQGNSGTITPKRIPPWIEKTKPETKINVLGSTAYELDTFHDITQSLVDTLRRASTPYSGLPGNLTVSPEKMKHMSVPDVLRLADDISAWRQAEADKALKAAFRESSLVKELPDFDLAFAKGKGGAWVELPPAVDEKGVRICTSIGSAGGWCTMDEKMAVYYGEQGKLFALLDGDGRPHIQISSVGPDIEEIKFPENSPSGERSKSYEKKDKEYIDKVSKAVIDFLNGRKLGYVNQIDIRKLSVGGRPIIDKNRPTGSSKLSEKENDAIRQKHPELFQEGAPRFFVAPPVGFSEGGAVRVPEGKPDEMTSGVGSLAGRAREMFRVEPLDYRPAARGARAAAERLGEELSAPGRVPAPDTRQQLERMARDALEAGRVAGEIGYELTVPGDLTDVALMALMGPGARVGGKMLRRGIGATLMALDPEEVVLNESAVKNYANGGEVHSGVGSLASKARDMTRRAV